MYFPQIALQLAFILSSFSHLPSHVMLSPKFNLKYFLISLFNHVPLLLNNHINVWFDFAHHDWATFYFRKMLLYFWFIRKQKLQQKLALGYLFNSVITVTMISCKRVPRISWKYLRFQDNRKVLELFRGPQSISTKSLFFLLYLPLLKILQ